MVDVLHTVGMYRVHDWWTMPKDKNVHSSIIILASIYIHYLQQMEGDNGVDSQPAFTLQIAGSVGEMNAYATYKVGDNPFWNASGSIGNYQIQFDKPQIAGQTMTCNASIQG
jgi:hypothetical protein